jgi:hypothetical protein
MNAKEYFSNANGKGFLATSNAKGEVNIAVYSRPIVQENGQFVFGMTDRLTHANVQENGKAVYAFIEEKGFGGKRFYLNLTKDDNTGPLLEQIRRMTDQCLHPGAGKAVKYVVTFKVNKELPLICAECPGDHTQHLCEIAGTERFALIKALATQPDFMCMNCGRMADKAESLCNPMAMEDIPGSH